MTLPENNFVPVAPARNRNGWWRTSTLFQIIERSVLDQNKAIVLDVFHIKKGVALLPKFEEDVEYDFLRPFFLFHIIVGYAEESVVSHVIEVAEGCL